MSYTKGKWGVDGLFIYHEDSNGLKTGICTIDNIDAPEEEMQANAHLIAAAPELAGASKSFLDGWLHFCNCINFGKSNLDADAIRFMNEVPGKIETAYKAAMP